MPTRKQRWLAFYVLVFPRGQALLGLYLPISLGMILILKVPV